MPKLKSGTIIPTPEEAAAINAGIAADPDNPELTEEWFAKAKPASEILTPETYTALIAKRRDRTPRSASTADLARETYSPSPSLREQCPHRISCI